MAPPTLLRHSARGKLGAAQAADYRATRTVEVLSPSTESRDRQVKMPI